MVLLVPLSLGVCGVVVEPPGGLFIVPVGSVGVVLPGLEVVLGPHAAEVVLELVDSLFFLLVLLATGAQLVVAQVIIGEEIDLRGVVITHAICNCLLTVKGEGSQSLMVWAGLTPLAQATFFLKGTSKKFSSGFLWIRGPTPMPQKYLRFRVRMIVTILTCSSAGTSTWRGGRSCSL